MVAHCHDAVCAVQQMTYMKLLHHLRDRATEREIVLKIKNPVEYSLMLNTGKGPSTWIYIKVDESWQACRLLMKNIEGSQLEFYIWRIAADKARRSSVPPNSALSNEASRYMSFDLLSALGLERKSAALKDPVGIEDSHQASPLNPALFLVGKPETAAPITSTNSRQLPNILTTTRACSPRSISAQVPSVRRDLRHW